MFIVGMLSWWYGVGWVRRARMVRERLAGTLDYFSIGLLISTFFAPFRQISAGKVDGSLDVQFRAFIDRTISRVIGAITRSVIIIIGCLWIIVHAAIGGLTLILWAFVPLLPIVGLILFLSGWTPSWM